MRHADEGSRDLGLAFPPFNVKNGEGRRGPFYHVNDVSVTGWEEGSPIERTSLRPCNPALEFQIFAMRKTHSYWFKGPKVNH